MGRIYAEMNKKAGGKFLSGLEFLKAVITRENLLT